MTTTRLWRPLALGCAAALAATAVASAAEGGRVDLTTPIRELDTRSSPGSRVTNAHIGAGVFTVWTLQPTGSGSAVIHPCAEAAPTDEATFRFVSTSDLKFATFATADDVCLTSDVPVHVIVDRKGTVATAPTATESQYVPLATPVELWNGPTTSKEQTLHLGRPAQLGPSATAAVVSVEVIHADDTGYVRAIACSDLTLAADVSYRSERVANVAYVELAPSDDLCVFVYSPAHVRVRLLGELAGEGPDPALLPPSWRYVPGEVPAPSLRPINPARVLDTRDGTGGASGMVDPDEVVELDFGDLVDSQTTAVVLNVTARLPETAGYVTAWPCGGDRPLVSNLNFLPGDTVPNLVVAKLGPGGTVCLSSTSRTHLIADLNATFQVDGGLLAEPVTPDRILDTRRAVGVPTTTKLAAGSTLELEITGGSIPAAAGAATVNMTAAAPDDAGFLTAYPCDEPRPTASNLNYAPGDVVANLVTAKLSADGRLCIYTSATTHVIADLAAWYGVEQPSGLVELAPERFLDTRHGIGVSTTDKVAAGGVVTLQVAGIGLVPDDADAVVMNVTAAAPDDAGFVTAWPCDRGMPVVSNLNYVAGGATPNLATVKLAADGTVCLYTLARSHLIADVSAYLTSEPVAGQELTLE